MNRVRGDAFQDRGLDTGEANGALGPPADARDHGPTAAVLRHFGLRRVMLLASSPAKCGPHGQCGLRLAERVPLEVAPNRVDLAHRRARAVRLGHALRHVPSLVSDPRGRTVRAGKGEA